MAHSELHDKTFLLLLALVTLAFCWILLPFFDAVFWGTVLAIVFRPLYRRQLERLHGRRNLAALVTLLLCLVLAILPLSMIGSLLIKEAVLVYESAQAGHPDIGRYLQQAIGFLPDWAIRILDRNGLTDLNTLREKLSAFALQGSRFLVAQAVAAGQNTFRFLTSFVLMLYLLFFLLRDGAGLAARIRQALPLSPQHKQRLFGKFTTVIRATIKGNFVVSGVQGLLGGIIFALLGISGAALWGAVMAFLSLLPAIGAALVWAPVAIYFLFTGDIWRGLVLLVFGTLVIGLVDNFLRPILVGKDTRMPDYLVLVSTLGGLILFGLSGFIIGPVIAALFVAAWDLFAPAEEMVPPPDNPPGG